MNPAGETFGIGLRRDHFDAIVASPPDIDFLEVLSENFMRYGGRPREVLDHVASRYPVVLHGVALSIGSLDPLDARYLEGVARLAERTRAAWWSDHLSYSSAHGVEYHDLVPLPFTRECVDHVAARVRLATAQVGRPFALENPSYYVRWAGEMDEASFVSEVVQAADCKLLLDVNNVFVNACNHGYDARAYIDRMPLERVVQIHMAGHDASGPVVIDTHGAPVKDEVLDLYGYTMARLRARGVTNVATLLEWDHDIPSLEHDVAELARVRAVAAARRPGGVGLPSAAGVVERRADASR